jgi:hypothetical protein
MTIPSPSRFVFRANAIPVSGRVLQIKDEPGSQSLQSPPGSSLSVAGGFCQAISPGSVFRDIFSWGQCVAQSQGELKGDRSHVTTLTSSIQNVSAANGPNVFTAGQLKLTLTSIHPVTGQPTIVPTEAVFGGQAGIELNKTKITVTTDLDDFRKLGTLERFDKEFQGNEAVYKKYRDRFLTKDGKPPAFKQPIPRVQGGFVVSSFVSSIQWGKKKIPGNVLRFEGFGSIYFGEVVMNEYNRRFTLVRLEMGSDVRADVAFAEGEANGSWIP